MCGKENTPPVIMTIATTDSGGGAGIQADLKTITCLGGFGVSVVGALTAQNGTEVRAIHELPGEFITQQFETVLDGFPVKAAKTGMLPTATVIETLVPFLKRKKYPLVVDPVCVSESGYRLMEESAFNVLKKQLIPLADLLTPNRFEAEALTGMKIQSCHDLEAPARALLAMGAKAVLMKGGHLDEYAGEKTITDWLALPNKALIALPHGWVDTENKHGTGCTLSAAIATFLGYGHNLEMAIKEAQAYLTKALAAAYAPGIGAGPPNFLAGVEK